MTTACLVYITAPNREQARRLACTLVEERLAACANILSDVESHYWWQGKLESSNEVSLILKTTSSLETALIARAKALHPYDCPAIVTMPIQNGFQPFLDWIAAETRLATPKP